MAQDDRQIKSAIRLPGTGEGKAWQKGTVVTDPDELVASGVDLQALHDSGAITGTWKGVKPKNIVWGTSPTEPKPPETKPKGKK